MMIRGIAWKLSVLIAFVVAGLGLTSGLASAGERATSKKPPIVWIDLSGTAQIKPNFIFFTANSGPQVRNVKWNGWGKKKTVARGHYTVTSPPPPGRANPKGPARIIAWKPIRCVPGFGNRKGKTVRVYRHAKMLRPVPAGGRKWTDISAYTGYLTCNQIDLSKLSLGD